FVRGVDPLAGVQQRKLEPNVRAQFGREHRDSHRPIVAARLGGGQSVRRVRFPLGIYTSSPAASQSSATAAVHDCSSEPSGSAVYGSKYSAKRDVGRSSKLRFSVRKSAAAERCPSCR